MLFYAMLCHAMLCCIIPYVPHFVGNLCFAMMCSLCYDMLCNAVLHPTMGSPLSGASVLWQILPCYAMLCYATRHNMLLI